MFQGIVNDELHLSWPGNFAVMSEEEMKKAYSGNDSDRWGLRDPKRDTIIAVVWKKSSPLALRLTNPKKMLKSNEKRMKAIYRNYNYKLEFFFTRMVANTICGGYCYTYRLGNRNHAVKTVLVPRKRCLYSISCYGKAENTATDYELFDKVLDCVKFPGM